MPRSTPAADAAMPETVPAPDLAAEVVEWPNWRYVGPLHRMYGNVPVTPQPGDVITWPDCPSTDGAWEQTTDPVTRRPDNWRPDMSDDEAARLRGDTPGQE